MIYLSWDTQPRKPLTRLPVNACDCSVHVFGPADDPGLDLARKYDPPAATIDDLQRVHTQLGIQRAILVQASIYGTDHSVLIDSLRRDPLRYRGIAIVDDSISDEELGRLHHSGVRGARYNMLSRSGARFDEGLLHRTAQRIAAKGWTLSLHGAMEDFLRHQASLRPLRLPTIIDNLAYFDAAADCADQGLALLKALLDTGNWWIKISRADLRCTPPYDDTLDTVRRVVALRPDRIVWGTDWPHVLYGATDSVMPNDADLVDLLARQVPDASVREMILSTNPARLFGFTD